MSVKFANYGQMREVNATEGEKELFERIMSILDSEGIDTSKFALVRKSDNYVTVALLLEDPGQLDLARIKYTDRAKWLRFVPDSAKFKITSLDDIYQYKDKLIESYRFNEQCR